MSLLILRFVSSAACRNKRATLGCREFLHRRQAVLARGEADMSSTTIGFDTDLTRHSSIRQALSSSSTACVLNVAREPFEIVAVNSAWSKLCCYSPEEALYKNRKHIGDDVPDIHGPFSPQPADGPRGSASRFGSQGAPTGEEDRCEQGKGIRQQTQKRRSGSHDDHQLHSRRPRIRAPNQSSQDHG